jgi:hypothetical protein
MTSKIEKNNTCYISKNFFFFIVLILIWYIYNKIENTTWFTKHNLLILDIIFYWQFANYFRAYFCYEKAVLPERIHYNSINFFIINIIILGIIIYLDNYNNNYNYDFKYDFSKNMILLKNKVFIKENTTIIIAKVFKYIILFGIINSYINTIYKTLYFNIKFENQAKLEIYANHIKTSYLIIELLILYLLIKLILIFYKKYFITNDNNIIYNSIVKYIDYIILFIVVIFI